MMRLKRIITSYELIAQSGARGVTLEDLRERLCERGFAVDRRQLYRDLRDMKGELDMPIESSDDISEEQQSSGARVVYYINRLSPLRKSLVTSGKAIAGFEAAGNRLWGRAAEEGLVVLHCDRGMRAHEVIGSYERRFSRSRVLYLGEHMFAHFSLEVPRELAFDLHVRLGRVQREQQHPGMRIEDDVVLIGFAGYPLLSRLFGPHAGHVGSMFHAEDKRVDVLDLAANAGDDWQGLGRLVWRKPRAIDLALDATPAAVGFDETEKITLSESVDLRCGGASLYLWC